MQIPGTATFWNRCGLATADDGYAESFAIYMLKPQRNAALNRECPVTWAYHKATAGVPSF